VICYLKYNHFNNFNQLLDVTCVDYPQNRKRFEINYNLLSLSLNERILLKIGVKDKDYIYSVTDLYSSAGWLEREVWDMFGIYFVEHMDLRRILTDYGFDGFPLRKDFPLIGFVEVRYDSGFKYIRIEPVQIMQEMRVYSSNSPWVKI
jgi:NADH-quinone oxidoreductase subunit C